MIAATHGRLQERACNQAVPATARVRPGKTSRVPTVCPTRASGVYAGALRAHLRSRMAPARSTWLRRVRPWLLQKKKGRCPSPLFRCVISSRRTYRTGGEKNPAPDDYNSEPSLFTSPSGARRHESRLVLTQPYYNCATLEKRTPDVKRKFQIRRKS